jgi:glycerol-3-phosphate dehydrogenase (NAD(P)+)
VSTVLLARREEQAAYLAEHRANPDYLTFVDLPPELSYGSYDGYDFSSVDLVIIAVPSKGYANVIDFLAAGLPAGIGVLSLTKGLDPGTGRRFSRVLSERLAPLHPAIAVLSGPNHAEEVALRQPTATVISSPDAEFATVLQELVSDETFRAYVNLDLVGVEFASAVKNVIALATGMSDGLGYGDNARAALITRGLAEMARLGVALGAEAATFSGLAGLGDLVATCTSRHSRNRVAGELIAQGHAADQVETEIGMVAEGLTTAPVVLKLAREAHVETPITENVVAVLADGKDIQAAVGDLMSRRLRNEVC